MNKSTISLTFFFSKRMEFKIKQFGYYNIY